MRATVARWSVVLLLTLAAVGVGWVLLGDTDKAPKAVIQPLASASASTQPAPSQSTTVPSATASSTPTPLPAAPDLEAGEVQRLETALSSSDPAVVASIMTRRVGRVYRSSPDAVLPSGSEVTLEADAFKSQGNLATVPVTVVGPQPARWLLLLAYEDGQWRALGTRAPSP